VAPLVERPTSLGEQMFTVMSRLFPICRSITGDGVRETLAILSERIPLEIREVPSGTEVLDWTVPLEWNIRDAYVADSSGHRWIDFQASNLHVVNYSVPVRARLPLDELRPRLHTLPERPAATPYRTSYYVEDWGFCLSQEQLEQMPEGDYDVVIDSTLEPGHLTYGEFVIPGRDEREVLISAHVCHPSLCDDNLSGIAIAAFLADLAKDVSPQLTMRFLFAPGTIGTIAWLAANRARVDRIVAGLTLTCLGDGHPFTFKRTESGGSLIDRVAAHVMQRCLVPGSVIDYFPYGYDERQYNSAGFRAPVGSLMRGRHGQFPEYHTSDDNLGFVSVEHLVESFDLLNELCGVIDANRTFVNLQPFAEPQLGRRGLYHALGGRSIPDAQLAMLWLLNQSDGHHDLLAIAERSGCEFDTLVETASVLESHGLLQAVDA
jgi:aminopeptidase-like protein